MTAQETGRLNYSLCVEDGFSLKDEATKFMQLVVEQEKKLGALNTDINAPQLNRGMSIALVNQQAMLYIMNSVLKLGMLMGEAKAYGDMEKVKVIDDYFTFHFVPISSNRLLAGLASLNEYDRNALQLALNVTEDIEISKNTAA